MALAAGPSGAAPGEPYDYANPMIGTGGEGHTYPGATVPFGLVQLSPDTSNRIYKGNFTECCYPWAAGYRYEDKVILGFSHTHFSGTGHSDFGDILIMPTTGALNLQAGSDTEAGLPLALQPRRRSGAAGLLRRQPAATTASAPR